MSRKKLEQQKTSQINRRDFLKVLGLGTASTISGCIGRAVESPCKAPSDRPNVLFCISDDQSWLHTTINGCKVVKTPNFDRIARGGVLFSHSFNDYPEGVPFCFWYGGKEPHRVYEQGSGLRAGKKLEDVKVPAFLPDTPEIRSDILDYCVEIEWFDKHLGRMLRLLEQIDQLDNTIVVVTSDNGMPFPRAKTNLYDYGTRMPLAVRWGKRLIGGRVVDDFVSLTDVAPTFLEAAGLRVPAEMTGRSLMAILLSGKSGRVDPGRDRVFTAIERHTWCRPNGVGYPSRAVRTHRWLYIRNYEPGRWPAGDPDFDSPHQSTFGDIDNGPTKTYMMEHKDDPNVAPLFKLGFGKRPAEELYDVTRDPDQVHNLADDPAFAKVKKKLRSQLEQDQRDTRDPRVEGKSPWDHYPYYYGDYWKRAVRSRN